MSKPLSFATVQLTSTHDVPRNLAKACELTEEAAAAGAQVVLLPENFGFLGPDEQKLPHAQTVEHGEFLRGLREIAKKRHITVIAGSIPERGPDERHTYNTSVVIGPDGSTLAIYRKIHMFDVELGDLVLKESASVAPGNELRVVRIEGFEVGLSICYDLRFPELYRGLSAQGATILTVPAAFTLQTGKDHWDVLLRARAIENQCFVVAAGQFGHHGGNRISWGKSQIIDPWGVVLAKCPEREGFVVAQLYRDDLERARSQVPCLTHRRL